MNQPVSFPLTDLTTPALHPAFNLYPKPQILVRYKLNFLVVVQMILCNFVIKKNCLNSYKAKNYSQGWSQLYSTDYLHTCISYGYCLHRSTFRY